MAENQYVHPENGAEVREQDINLISKDAALADDRTLWELLRLRAVSSGTPQKAILPYGKAGWRPDLGPDNATPLHSTALVQGNAANGSVYVLPFRAIVGSTTASPTYDVEYLRGERSFYLLGSAWHGRTVAIAANASGNPRWTLVYAIVGPDVPGDSANYVKKDPGTGFVSLVVAGTITTKTTVTVSTVDGTPAGSPTKPNLPSDGGGLYKIALAYLWIPTGFNGASAVGRSAIFEVAPCLSLHSTTGASTLEPANQQYAKGGTIDVNQDVPTDRSVQPGAYVPPTMRGKEELIVLFQLGNAPISHLDGDVVDDSRDWRFRYFKWTAFFVFDNTGTAPLASDRNTAYVPGTTTPVGSVQFSLANGPLQTLIGAGQSFVDDTGQVDSVPTSLGVADGNGIAFGIVNANAPFHVALGQYVVVYVRNTDGALIFKQSGGEAYQILLWLEATGPYSNYGTV